MVNAVTPNFRIPLPQFDKRGWQDDYYNAQRIVDALLAKFVAINNVQGVWQNSTTYAVGDTVVDAELGLMFRAQVAHTSPSAGSFGQARIASPDYWGAVSVANTARGEWTAATEYFVGDFVYSGVQYAVCLVRHTSSASFANDVSAGLWAVLIDGQIVVDDATSAAVAAALVAINPSVAAAAASALAAATSATNASNAQTAAENAQTAAENAQTGAEAAEDGAVIAKDAAEAAAAAGLVKVSADDTTGGRLEDKLLVGAGLALSTQDAGANETRTINHDFASEAEAEAGTAEDKPMNALRVAQAIAALTPPAASPIAVPLELQSASNSPVIQFDDLPGDYDDFIIIASDVVLATDGQGLIVRVGTGAGPTIQNTNYKRHTANLSSGSASYAASVATAGTGFGVNTALGNAAGEAHSGIVHVFGVHNTSRYKTMISHFGGIQDDANVGNHIGSCSWMGGTDAITSLQIVSSSGNITSGDFILYGIKRS